jgi:hypothetical protein
MSQISLVCVYAPEDEQFCSKLEKHLEPLQRQNGLTFWDPRHIRPGENRKQIIDEHLSTAAIILFLVSSDLFSPDYGFDEVIKKALRGEAHVIPILLRSFALEGHSLASLQCLPSNTQAITSWKNEDEALLNVAGGIRQTIESLSKKNDNRFPSERTKLLTNLDKTYRQYHDRLLQEVSPITLNMPLQMDESYLQSYHPDRPEKTFSSGQSIRKIYDRAEGKLLILGRPGSGKSLMLIDLARRLVRHARNDESQPPPVIFNLPSWAEKHEPLDQWLIKELDTKYKVPLPIARSWVLQGYLTLLLDGLDEVAKTARGDCINAINVYRNAHSCNLVVCSRINEYHEQKHNLQLKNTIIIQPLTSPQINKYLEQEGAELEGVRVALKQNPVLSKLASSPLMLHVMIVAYRGDPASALPENASLEEQQYQIFAKYTSRMVYRGHREEQAQQQHLLEYLHDLALQMQKHDQTAFYLENIQYTWLQTNKMRRIYDWFAVRIPGGIIGLIVSLAINMLFFMPFPQGVFFERIVLGGWLGMLLSYGNIKLIPGKCDKLKKTESRLLRLLGSSFLVGLCVGLGEGLYYAAKNNMTYALEYALWTILCFSLFSLLLQIVLWCLLRNTNKFLPIWYALPIGLAIGLSYGISSLLFSLTFTSSSVSYDLRIGLSDCMDNGLIYALIGGLLSALLVKRSALIHPTDLFSWSWKGLREGMFSKQHILTAFLITAAGAIFGGLSQSIVNFQQTGSLININQFVQSGDYAGLGLGLNYWLLLGLQKGTVRKTIDDKDRMLPNQGIRDSLFVGIGSGYLSGVLSAIVNTLVLIIIILFDASYQFVEQDGLIHGMVDTFQYWHQIAWLNLLVAPFFEDSLILGLLIGLLASMLNGGLSSLRHYVLRFLLWKSTVMTFWNYVPVLDNAARCILLYQVGGGYIFIHRLYRDYIATLTTPSSIKAIVDPPKQAEASPA